MRIGLRLGISSSTYGGSGGGGSPVDYLATFEAMFASSEAGEIWPVHEDYFFTDTACTTPVSAVGQEVKGWLGAKYGTKFTQSTAGRIPLYARQPVGGWTQKFLQSDNPGASPWVLTRASATGGQSDYDGGSNGWLLQTITASGSTSNTQQWVPRGEGAHIYSVLVKAGTVNRVLMGQYLTGGYSDNIFDLVSGTWVTTGAGVTRGQTDLGGGWWLLSLTYTGPIATNTALPVYYIGPINSAGTSITDTTIGNNIVIYRPMLNSGSARATYEARGAVHEGPSSGASVAALYFDGVSDSMVTPSISFTGTDKITVFAGWDKMSYQNAYACLIELSAAPFGTSGTFLVLEAGSGGSANNLYFGCYSTTLYERYLTQPMGARDRARLTVGFDLSAGASAISASVTDIQGTFTALTTATGTGPGTAGNFGNYPLYIGARGGGTTLEANGYFVGALVVLGRAATAQELTDGDAALEGLS